MKEFVEILERYLNEYTAVKQILLVILVFVAIWVFLWSFKKFLRRVSRRRLDPSAVPLINDLVKYAAYALGLVLSLNILGVNTTGIMAMISAASLAIGFALKDTLSNVASGILILFLSPFKAKDYIECGDVKGEILGVGLFNTTLKTLSGLYVSAPNSSLWGAPIVNFTRNKELRLTLTVGVSYGASLDKVFEVLRKMIADEPRFLTSPAPSIFVQDLADSSVNITLWVWTSAKDYWALKESYLEKIKRLFDENGIEIPFPQQVVHIAQK